MNSIAALLVAGVLIWFWVDSLRARERALEVGAAACRQTNAQMLDQTVSLVGFGIGLSRQRQLLFRRRYRFEFSTNGVNRWYGIVILLGPIVESVQMDHPEGSTILSGSSREV